MNIIDEESESVQEAIQTLKTAVTSVISIIDDKVATITGDLIEPLEMYIGHHEETSRNQLESAK